MLGKLVTKSLYIAILCYFVQNEQCAATDDDPDSTPAPRASAAAAAADPTPGRRVVEAQAQITREKFIAFMDADIVDSWGVRWEVLANQVLPFDNAQKRNNLRVISERLRDINNPRDPARADPRFARIRTDPQFTAIRGGVATIREDMQAVHARRLEELAECYFASPAFPIGGASLTGYTPKPTGDQLGGIATVALPGRCEARYFVKTHGGGHLSSHSSAAKPVNPAELMVYRVLDLSGFGCPAHFFHRDVVDVYIATLDAAVDPSTWRQGQFLTFGQYSNPGSAETGTTAGRLRGLWGSLESIPVPTPDANQPAIEASMADDLQAQHFIGQIAALDMLSRILRLTDMFNNPDNFGFVMHDGSELPRLKAIDFRILDTDRLRITSEQYGGFLEGNGHFNYAGVHRLLGWSLHYRAAAARSQTARHVLSADGPLGRLRDVITQAHDATRAYIGDPAFAEHRERLMAMLGDYRTAALHNLGRFNATLNHGGSHDEVQCFECESARKLAGPAADPATV